MRLAVVLLFVASASAADTLVFRSWDPGHFPGKFGRTTVTLTSSDGPAMTEVAPTLEAVTEEPAATFRRQSNASGWVKTSSVTYRHTFTERRKRETISWFETDAGVLRLACRPGAVAVHPAGARILDVTCDCDAPCVKPDAWQPAATKQVTGLTCSMEPPPEREGDPQRTFAPAPGVLLDSEPLFFTTAPGVEAMRGKGDCPVRGYREAREPTPDWSMFPEGTTALREFEARLAKKAPSSSKGVTKVVRTGRTLEVTRDEVAFKVGALDQAAVAGDRSFALSCWRESRVVHSSDVRFKAGRGDCDGREERASSRAGKPTPVLVCRPTVDGVVQDEPLVFVAGKTIERVDIDADCTVRRALRFIDSLAAPTLPE